MKEFKKTSEDKAAKKAEYMKTMPDWAGKYTLFDVKEPTGDNKKTWTYW